MTKLIAVLKDSFREAVDFKTLYVMISLSLVTVFFCFTVAFRAAPAKDALDQLVLQLPPGPNVALMMQGVEGGFPVIYLVDDLKTEETSKPWRDTYEFTLTAMDQVQVRGAFRAVVAMSKMSRADTRMTDEEPMRFLARLSEKAKEVTAEDMEEFVRKHLNSISHVDVESVKVVSEKNNEVKFRVLARGTDDAFQTWPHKVNFLFGIYKTDNLMLPLGPVMYRIENWLVSYVGAAIALLISTIITAFFIPNMLRKGNVDLLISKPISRPTLLVYKYLGGLTFMFLNTLVVVGGLWIALGFRTGIWAPAFLLTIAILTFEFAIYYAVSTLFAVLTRSPIVAILVTCAFWAFLFGEGLFYRGVSATRDLKVRPMADSVYTVEEVLHFVLPRITDLDMLTTYGLAKNLLPPGDAERQKVEKQYANVNWTESITMSLVFIGVLLGLSCWRFSTRDY